MKPIEKKVAEHVTQFNKGDTIEGMVDGNEMEGLITEIDGNFAKIATPWGYFKTWLPSAKKIGNKCQWCSEERPNTPGTCPTCHRFPTKV